MHKRLAPFFAVLAAFLPACGSEDPAPERPARAGVTCAEIRTKAQAMAVARRVDHRVVAPDGQPRRETLDAIAGSLYATCRQPGWRDRRPVPGVLRAVQQHFDQDALNHR